MEAVDLINNMLHLQLTKTVSETEFKGHCPDLEGGGMQKFYLNHQDCLQLSQAFINLSKELTQPKPGMKFKHGDILGVWIDFKGWNDPGQCSSASWDGVEWVWSKQQWEEAILKKTVTILP